MDQATSRAVEAMLERASFYAELTSIVIAAFLGAFLVLLLQRLRKRGLSMATLVVIGVSGTFVAFALCGFTAYYIFDLVYVPFLINPPPSVKTHLLLPVWVHPSFSRLAVIISIISGGVVSFLWSRNIIGHERANAEQLVRADASSGPR